MAKVSAKKHLGQHFLTDAVVAERIAICAHDQINNDDTIIEIGPGTGALTKHLEHHYPNNTLLLCEIDRESIAFLTQEYGFDLERLVPFDFLGLELAKYGNRLHVCGNFPYHISTQIMFKILDNVGSVTAMHGMFQKEVAERICAKPGSKTYGILSVLIQAYYHVEYCFSVGPEAFEPPPKVASGVMKMWRKAESEFPDVPFLQLKRMVKTAFNMRRKMLRNSLKELGLTHEHPFAQKRPEQLTVSDFTQLCKELF